MRHLFTLCSLVSLLMCVLWARSYFRQDVVRVAREGSVGATFVAGNAGNPFAVRAIIFKRGRMEFAAYETDVPGDAGSAAVRWERWVPDYYSMPCEPGGDPGHTLRWEVLGFGGFSVQGPGGFDTRQSVPHWLPLALFSLPAMIWVRRRQRESRRTRGLCLVCGYDLRASPERCPECGDLAASNVATRHARITT